MAESFLRLKNNNWYYISTSTALADLKAHIREIDCLLPFWYGITAQGTLIDWSQSEAIQIAKRNNVPILAMVHNYSDSQMSELVHELLIYPILRDNLINSIENMLKTQKYAGVNICFKFVPPADREALNIFMERLYKHLTPGFMVTISVPAKTGDDPGHPFSGAFDYGALSVYSDGVFIMTHDEHFSKPAPLASIGFIHQVLDYAITRIPRNKIVLGIGIYGYEHASDGGMPRILSYYDAINLASRTGAHIIYDVNSQESTFTYYVGGTNHIVWFEDFRSFSSKIDLVNIYDLSGISVWRLGLEDRRDWTVIRTKLKGTARPTQD